MMTISPNDRKEEKKKGQGILMFEVLGVNLKYNAPQRNFFFF
jgi:hypothetical protein